MTNIESFEGGTKLLQKLRGDMEAENFWFEPGFDSNLVAFIRANPLPYAGLSCFVMSFRYAVGIPMKPIGIPI
jgi:hypothetical protein